MDYKVALYPDPEVYPDYVIKLSHKKDVGVKVKELRKLMKIKKSGELAGVAFYLKKAYNWIMAEDDEGNLCLLPRKKL